MERKPYLEYRICSKMLIFFKISIDNTFITKSNFRNEFHYK